MNDPCQLKSGLLNRSLAAGIGKDLVDLPAEEC